MKKILAPTFVVALFSGFFTAALAQSETSPAAELTQLLQKAQSLKGHFEQRLYDREQHLLQTTEGEFVVQRPGNFYWETLPPYEQLVVGNPDTLWVYDPDLEQVTVREQVQQPNSPARLLSGDLDNLAEHYTVTRTREEGLTQFTLVGTADNAMFERVQLTYRDATLAGLLFEDTMEQVTELSFSDIELNPTTDPAIFQFKAPEGVDVIIDG